VNLLQSYNANAWSSFFYFILFLYFFLKMGLSRKLSGNFEGHKDLFLLCRFGTSNYRLYIVQVGRGQNINGENRVCNLCQDRELGDEYHSNALNLNTKKKIRNEKIQK
jgi:hypothetical protein